MASDDSVSSPTAAAAAAQSEFKFRILANRPDVVPATSTAPPPTTTTGASASGLAATFPAASCDLEDDPTAGDETLGDISHVAEDVRVDPTDEGGGGGGGANPALASDSPPGAASERVLDDRVRLRPWPL